MTLALCTVLAMSAASLQADAQDKDQNQGGTGANASTQTGAAGKLSRDDEKFVRDAAKGSTMEIQMGKLAAQKAQSDAVKQFAQRLVDDHTKASTELKQIASSKGITLPDPSGSQTASTTADADRTQVRERADTEKSHAAHAEMTKKLEGLSGADFDRAFVRMALTHHEKDVKEFEKASEKCDDPAVKAFAAKTLPTLREHLSQAKSLQAQLGGAGAPDAKAGQESGNQSSGTKSSSGTGTGTQDK